MLDVQDHDAHARMRKIIGKGFTEKALKAQEPLILSYFDLFIKRLKEKATSPETNGKGAVVDMVEWYNFLTFDIIGDLGLGQSFDCLETSHLHSWISIIFEFFIASAYLAAVRFYPLLESILMRCIPPNILKMQRDHNKLSHDRIDRRMNLETKRDDFMTPLLEQDDEKAMTVDEIRATFPLIILAGSETTASALSGMTTYLLQNPMVLQKLVKEIRGFTNEEKDFNFESVKELPYLNAVIEEGLRLCPPLPYGLPRMIPRGGDTVCGEWFPGGVRHLPFPFLNLPYRSEAHIINQLDKRPSPCVRAD